MNNHKLVLLFLVFVTLEGVYSNESDLIKRAEDDINEEVKEMMKLGARSKRFVHKKITPL